MTTWHDFVAGVLLDLALGDGDVDQSAVDIALAYTADHLIADGVVAAIVFEHPPVGYKDQALADGVVAALRGLWERSFGPMTEEELRAAAAAAVLYHKAPAPLRVRA